MAPEAIKGSRDARCDLWSCGVIMFLLLTGRLPFAGKTHSEVMKNIARGRLRLSGLSQLSAACRDLLVKLLKVDPELRISAQNVLEHPWVNPPRRGADPLPVKSDLALSGHWAASTRKKGICIAVIVRFLSMKQLLLLKREAADVQGRPEEMEKLLARQAIALPANKMKLLVSNLDCYGPDSFDFEEFLDTVIRAKAQADAQRVWWLFQSADSEKTGSLSSTAVWSALQKLGKALSQSQVEALLGELNAEQISFEVFRYLVDELTREDNVG